MKDFIGNELNVYDIVVMANTRKYGMVRGSIVSVSEQRVRVKFFSTYNERELNKYGQWVLVTKTKEELANFAGHNVVKIGV